MNATFGSMTMKTGKGRRPTIAWTTNEFKTKHTQRFTVPAKPVSMAEFDARLAAAYASQTVRELREAQEVIDHENDWVSLYRAILS